MADLKNYTPNYKFPYPLPGDAMQNTYARIQELAERIEQTYTLLGVSYPIIAGVEFMQRGDAAGGDLTGSTYPDPIIKSDAITTSKILNRQVTGNKIAEETITEINLADEAVTSDKLAVVSFKDGSTATTQAQSDGSTKVATTAYVDAYIAGTIPDGSISTAELADGAVTNIKVNASAGISYSKLALSNSIVNADVASAAAISYSKLNLTGSVLEADLAFSIATQAELDTHAGLTTSVHGITNTANLVYTSDSRLTDARTPTGGAGGVLSGTYPNPGFAVDMATQSELDTHASDTTSVHGIADTSVLATATDVSTAVSTHSSDTTSIHGIADTANLVLTSDARLSDARTPTSHAATHVPGGTDVLDYTKIVGYGTALPTWSATTHPAGVLWVVNTVGEPYSLYRSDGVSAWKQVGGGGASVTASDSAPSSPTSGALWFDSTTGKTFIWYVDGSSNQWVEVGEASQLAIPNHASTHIRGGSDIIDGDRITIDYVPTNYTRNSAASGAGNVTDLTAHLSGIDLILPAGILMPYAGSTEPTGWVFCYGQTVDSVANTAYARLFTAIGTTYGGSSASSFILPDLRGRAPFGKDNMGGSTASRITSAISSITATTLGAVGGDQRLHQHTHIQNAHSHSGLVSQVATPHDGSYAYMGNPSTAQYSQAMTSTTATNQNTGAGTAQNMPPTIITNYLIKL